MGYQHSGFWSCMDTLKEKNMLEELWNSGASPWKIWNTPAAQRVPTSPGALLATT